MSPFWWLTLVSSVALLLLAIGQMQRRSLLRHYPCLAGFLISLLLVYCAQIGQLMQLYTTSSAGYARLYWTNEFVVESLLILVMISFIHRALEGTGKRARVLSLVVFVVAVSAALTVLGPSSAKSWARWASELVRNLSFGAALLNVFLWQSLLKHRRNDIQLLLLALGVGFWTAGKATGQSLKLLTPGTQSVGNVLMVIAEMLSLIVWAWALSSFQARQTARQGSAAPTAERATPA